MRSLDQCLHQTICGHGAVGLDCFLDPDPDNDGCAETSTERPHLVDMPDRLTLCSIEEPCEPGRFIGTETNLLEHTDAGALSVAGADNLLDVKMLRRERVKLLRIE